MKLTVCIPAYNAADFIEQTVASVLSQSLAEFELIIIDNASTDATEGICRAIKDPRLTYRRNATNIGGAGNHSLCLDVTKTPYVKLLSADDVLLPGILQRQLDAIDADPRIGIASCNFTVTDEHLVPQREAMCLPGRWNGKQAIRACVSKVSNRLGGPSNYMLRLAHVGGIRFDPTYKWLPDLAFACDVLKHSDYVNVDTSGFLYRRHSASDSALSCPAPVRIRDELRFIREHSMLVPVSGYARIGARALRHALEKRPAAN